MSEHLMTATDETFDAHVLKSNTPVLVDFWAPWCQPCRLIAPHVAAIAKRFAGQLRVVKVDADESPETAMRYNLRGVPTLAMFRGGQVVDQVTGAIPQAQIADLVSRNLTAH